jgi:hypothetical protein
MVVEDFRQSCDTNYPLWYDGNAGPEQSVQGMSLWLRTRQEGIANGIARARAMGLTGLEVLHGPEISSVRFLEEGGLRSVLRDVLPNVRPDYVLYSSYESLNGKDPTQALKKDIERIRAISGVSDIIIGEAGYSRSLWRQDGVTRMEAAMLAAFESGVAYFICWNLNDQGVDSDFGVFDTSGALTPAGRLVARVLGGQME